MKSQDNVLQIGSRRELLVDDYLLDRIDEHVTHRLHHPESREAMLFTDKPWEGNACNSITVFQDGDVARMYFKAHNVDHGRRDFDKGADPDQTDPPQDTHPIRVAYAESHDHGLTWRRPDLDVVNLPGAPAKNLVWISSRPGLDVVGQFMPFKDTNPAAKHPYRALGKPRRASLAKVLFAMHSNDGIHFELTRREPVVRGYDTDSPQVAFWDPNLGCYRLYVRHHSEQGRDIFHATSEYLLRWTPATPLAYPDTISTQLYTSGIQPYCRAPHTGAMGRDQFSVKAKPPSRCSRSRVRSDTISAT